ncbi:MAG: hypothetical protein A2W10_03325 [Deltaproteobacteria bacterium RBG_16_55_12]|nr:MAG: hypothetical protein A2W10_03325 [Deltaproteobacteria bacterium RBG_16_55_12]
MRFKRLYGLFGATVIAAALTQAIAPAFAQEPPYKGKTVRLLVNFSAGGPTDSSAGLSPATCPSILLGTQ